MNKTQCVNCQAEMLGEYCAKCGEQRVTPELRSMRYIIGNIVSDLTTLDGKVWKTALTVLFRPGQLEKDFAQGRRVDYMKPITLFFLFNVLFVMFATISDFYVTLNDQLNYQPYSPYIRSFILDFIVNQGMDVNKFAEYYDQLVKALARSMIILQVPFFSLFITIVFYNKHYYAGDYFTYSLNMHGWLLIWVLALQLPLLLVEPIWETYLPDFSMGWVFVPITLIGLCLYILIASRKMFELSWLQCLWRLPFVLISIVISHQLFRFLQLLITTALVDVK
jgi:hypothetical protein